MKYIALLLSICFLFSCSTKSYPSERDNVAETSRLKKELDDKLAKEPWYANVKNVSVKETMVHVYVASSVNYENRKTLCNVISDFYYANPENRLGIIKMFEDGRIKLLMRRNGIAGECR